MKWNLARRIPRWQEALSDLGLFLAQSGDPAAAEAPLRRAMTIDQANHAPEVSGGPRKPCRSPGEKGKREEALQLYRQAAAGSDAKVAARSYASMAHLDPPDAAADLRNAVDAMGQAYGTNDRRVVVLLQELALVLRDQGDDHDAEPLLRRALEIQESAARPDRHLTVAIINVLGNLIEEPVNSIRLEVLERRALAVAEEEFGPESAELSATCTNLADVLWNQRDFAGAEQLYRRALAADSSLYGANRPEVAADMANIGLLLKETARASESAMWLRQALEIYEKTPGPDSAQANLVRQADWRRLTRECE